MWYLYHFVDGRIFIFLLDRFCGKGLVDITLHRIKMEILSRGKTGVAALGRWAVLGGGQLGLCSTRCWRLGSISGLRPAGEQSPGKVYAFPVAVTK